MSHIILRVIAKEWVVGIPEVPEFWLKSVPWRNEVEGKFERGGERLTLGGEHTLCLQALLQLPLRREVAKHPDGVPCETQLGLTLQAFAN